MALGGDEVVHSHEAEDQYRDASKMDDCRPSLGGAPSWHAAYCHRIDSQLPLQGRRAVHPRSMLAGISEFDPR